LRCAERGPPPQLTVAAEFVVQMFGLVGSGLQREAVVRAVLRTFARQSAASALDRLLGVAFGLNAAGVVEARRYIRHWLNHPLVWGPK
jgi:uncharacterized membrane protein required for colicin V production